MSTDEFRAVTNKLKKDETCVCGHMLNDHSYLPDQLLNDDLDCDICDCKKFRNQGNHAVGGKK
jgi:hypothetical protein